MKIQEKIKWSFAIVGSCLVLFVLCFGLTWMGIEWRGFFGPKRANVEREIFEATRSYNQAKIQELSKLRMQYQLADDDDKGIIASTVRHRFADYNRQDAGLTPELLSFLRTVNN